MPSRILFTLGLVAVAVGACAEGSGELEGSGGGSSDNSTGETTASTKGGMSGSATSSSASSGAGAGGAGGAGGGESCVESPCKLVEPQCGCDAEEQCTVTGADAAVTCGAKGDVAWKELCGPSKGDCGPGLLCVTITGVSLCGKFCDDDAQCGGPGGLCNRTLSDGNGGQLPGVTLCTESCDPSTGVGCPAKGTSCQIGREQEGEQRFFSTCLASGAGTQGASCAGNVDCAPSFGCINDGTSDMCRKYCKVNAPVCPAGTECVAVTLNMADIVLGNEQYGVCN